MKKFNILGYIKKFQLLIILVAVAAGIISYAVLKSRQTYISSAVIRYANSEAVSGLAPDGNPIDTTEVYSSNVISEVFSRLGISSSELNIDDMRSGVSVEPIRTDEETALIEANIANGTEVQEEPVEYKVSFTVKNGTVSDPEDFTRQFLDELIDSYISYYAENHINISVPAVNDISKINSVDYDYLEKAELLRDSISDANDQLRDRAEGVGEEFRSAATGYNFLDLQKEFYILKNIDAWDLFSYILENHITSEKDVLLAKYQNRIDDYNLTNENTLKQVEYLEGVISSYVTMMRESGNTNITYEYILDNIDSYWYTDETGEVFDADQTVEYDTMLGKYAELQTNYDNNLIEVAYCKYILDTYGASEDGNTNEARYKAEKMIDSLVEKTDRLFQIMETTNSEYNEYIGAQNIQFVSGIAVNQGISIGRYVILIVIVFGIIGCLGAIVLGRLIDIFDYYVYVDHKLNIPNRAYCDRYLNKLGKTILNGDFVCISVTVENLLDKNKIYGVEAVDGSILRLVKIMKGVFSAERDCEIVSNSLGQLLVFGESMTDERAEAYCENILKAIETYNESAECRLAVNIGIAEARSEGIYQIKDLMLRAIKNSDFTVPDDEDLLNGYLAPKAEASAVLNNTADKKDKKKKVKADFGGKSENKEISVVTSYGSEDKNTDSSLKEEDEKIVDSVVKDDSSKQSSGKSISKQLEELKKALKD